MPEITLTITDTQARVLVALEKIDGLSASDRMQPYFRDQTSNRAGIKSDEPAFVEQGLILLEDQAVLASQARELEAQRLKDEQDAVLVTEQQKAKDDAQKDVQTVLDLEPQTKPLQEVDDIKVDDVLFDEYPTLTPPEPKSEPAAEAEQL